MKPTQAKPHQTKPNQTKPNQAKPNQKHTNTVTNKSAPKLSVITGAQALLVKQSC